MARRKEIVTIAQVDNAKLARYIEIDVLLDAMKVLKTELDDEAETLERALIDQYQATSTQSVSANGKTVYLNPQFWAAASKGGDGKPDWDAACAAFMRLARIPEFAGVRTFIGKRFNVQTVSSWARELPRDDETMMPILPKQLQGKLVVTRSFKLSVRNAARGKR